MNDSFGIFCPQDLLPVDLKAVLECLCVFQGFKRADVEVESATAGRVQGLRRKGSGVGS